MKSLKVITLVGCLGLTSMLFTSCDNKEKQVKEFSERFAGFVENNEKDSIISYYPNAELIEGFQLKYDPETVKVESSEEKGTYVVHFNDDANMTVKFGEDGKLQVAQSNGLINVSKEKLDYAKKLGALKGVTNDAEMAKRMIIVDNITTDLFNNYVEKHKNAVKNLGFTVTYSPMFGMDEGKGYYTLRNMTDDPISESDYNITWTAEEMRTGRVSTFIKPGVAIPANGTAKIPKSFSWYYGETIKAITMSTPSQEEFFKKYKPDGTEYADYVKEHGDNVTAKGKLSNGPYDFAGVIGKNMKVHMHLDKGMKDGTYYYDKNGPKAVMTLRVKSFNPNTGELTIEEYNNDGVTTGNFVGTISGKEYTGTMTAFSGKSYPFTLTIQ